MAEFTGNYNLEKPAQTDYYDVDVFNSNADKIDAAMKANADAAAAAAKTANDRAEKRKQLTFANGAALTLADNTEYRGSEAIRTLSFAFPAEHFECWLTFTTAGSGALSLIFPADTIFCGTVPELENATYYEISIKDKAVILCAGAAGGSTLSGGA